MLIQIHIRDLATILALDLLLPGKSTMITGETGAGKSIFIEAIELALGGRSSSNLIRSGKERADIILEFDITHFPHVKTYLAEFDLAGDQNACIIRRVISTDGRSRCYVNGIPGTVQQVKELGELLFHLHGQHEQQVLLKPHMQRDILDRFADHLPLVDQVKQLAEEWKALDQKIQQVNEKQAERVQRLDYLRFQLDEINSLQLKVGEWELLEKEHYRLNHAEELIKNLRQANSLLAGDDRQTVLTLLQETRKAFELIQPLEPKTQIWMQTLQSIIIQLNDLTSELDHYLEHTDLDPEKLQTLEERVGQIFNLSRKHKILPAELVIFREQLQKEFDELNASDEDLQKLAQQKIAIKKSYDELTMRLSKDRKKAASKLEKEITITMRSLSLPHGEFKIELENIALENEVALHGNEKIIFLIKTNPDQTLQPLAKVISGGELSRLSLAAHLALAHRTSIPTLVFDEVDTGLSGATAEKIGKLLRKLGESYQVFCVTHQPQVAACGHQQLLVEKKFIDQTTHTHLRLLNHKERENEIARLLGGEKMTEKTLEHAQEILAGI